MCNLTTGTKIGSSGHAGSVGPPRAATVGAQTPEPVLPETSDTRLSACLADGTQHKQRDKGHRTNNIGVGGSYGAVGGDARSQCTGSAHLSLVQTRPARGQHESMWHHGKP